MIKIDTLQNYSSEIGNIWLEYLSDRNFSDYPTELFEKLSEFSELTEVLSHIQQSVRFMHENNISENLINAHTHASLSYVMIQLKHNRPEFIQFLFPPSINPYTTATPGDSLGRNLISTWEVQNRDKNINLIVDIAAQIIHEGITKAKSYFFVGSMFGEKTLTALEVADTIKDSVFFQEGGRKVHGLIFDDIGDDKIMTRLRARPWNEGDVRAIDAEMVNAGNLRNKLLGLTLNPGDVVIIDEAMFLSFDDNQCVEIFELIQEYNKKGVTLICTGLTTDFKAQDLPMYGNLYATSQEFGFHTHYFNGYYAYHNLTGQIASKNGKNYTTRHIVSMGNRSGFPGIVDFNVLPIKVGRSHKFIQYSVAPAEAHPFMVLQEDMELWSYLHSLSEQNSDEQQEYLDMLLAKESHSYNLES